MLCSALFGLPAEALADLCPQGEALDVSHPAGNATLIRCRRPEVVVVIHERRAVAPLARPAVRHVRHRRRATTHWWPFGFLFGGHGR